MLNHHKVGKSAKAAHIRKKVYRSSMEIKAKNIKEAILNLLGELFEIRISTTWKFRRICDRFLNLVKT